MSVYTPSEQDREKLKQQHGDAFKGAALIDALKERSYSQIIAVGDRVSQDIANSDIDADISIVDGSIQREDVGEAHFDSIEADRTFQAENPAGEITEDAWRAVRKACSLSCSSKLVIDGEEDLLALPAALFAPKDSVVVYGHWKKGAILMDTNKSNKNFVKNLLNFSEEDHMIVGGSWDIFHSGHRYILLTAIEKAKRIDVGITSDKMLEDKLGEPPFDSFDERKKNISEFLNSIGVSKEVRFIEINDIYGNAVEEGDRLLVTPEKSSNADKINEKRHMEGRESITVDVVEKLQAEDDRPISCTRMRKEEIDENGLI